MDLNGLDDFLRTAGSFNDEADCGGGNLGEPNLDRVLSDFQPEDVSDSGNGHSSPEYAFSPEMVVPFAEDSPINNLHEPGMNDVPVATQPLDSTNPFATAHLATEGKSNPLYDSNEAINNIPIPGPFANGAERRPVSMGGTINEPPMAGGGSPLGQPPSMPGKAAIKPSASKPNPKTVARTKSSGSKKKRKIQVKVEESSPMSDGSPEMVRLDIHETGGIKPDGAKKILFQHHEAQVPEMNSRLFDENYEELPISQFEVKADKGFEFKVIDNAFVCQKKNHFQVSVALNIKGVPKYVQIDNQLRPIFGCFLAIWGLKDETPQSTVDIEQSHVDRTKKPFEPAQINIDAQGRCKMTFNRLHFSETTANNMRKKGKPNPDQRHFILLIEFHVLADDESEEGTYRTAHLQKSQKIIVRASNPGQFDGEVDMKWVKGKVPDSIVHYGPVGINTDRPVGALAVNGDMSVTGHIMHPSDRRVKEGLVKTDTRQQMANVKALEIYDYQLTEAWAEHAGRSETRSETGVIAQDLQQVIPDAVRNTKQVVELSDGEVVNELLVVDMDRIFMENVGAVQELCKMTENLDNRIKELEELHVQVQTGGFKQRRSSRRASKKNKAAKKAVYEDAAHVDGPSKETLLAEEEDQEDFPVFKAAAYILVALVVFALLASTVILANERQDTDDDDGDSSQNASTSGPARRSQDFGFAANALVSTLTTTLTTIAL